MHIAVHQYITVSQLVKDLDLKAFHNQDGGQLRLHRGVTARQRS